MIGFPEQARIGYPTQQHAPCLPGPLADELRLVYFERLSAPGSCARRFGVSFDRLSEQIAGGLRKPRSARTPNLRAFHLDDAALAAACVDEAPGAWSQLFLRCETPLLREVEEFEGRTMACITVRRFFMELRSVNQQDAASRLNLRRYAGGTALETWLGSRLLAAAIEADGSPEDDRASENRLRLAMNLLYTERHRARGRRKARPAPATDAPAPGE